MKKPSTKVFLKQVGKLRSVETELMEQGKPLTNRNLITGLEAKGLKVDRFKLYRLKQTLGENNNFVLKIAESQYSVMVQDIYDKITFVEDACFDLAGKDWTQHEVQTSEDEDGHNYEKTTDNEHKPQSDFYRLVLDCQMAKMKIMSGDVINVSVAMIERNFDRIRDENQEYIHEIARLKEKLEKH